MKGGEKNSKFLAPFLFAFTYLFFPYQEIQPTYKIVLVSVKRYIFFNYNLQNKTIFASYRSSSKLLPENGKKNSGVSIIEKTYVIFHVCSISKKQKQTKNLNRTILGIYHTGDTYQKFFFENMFLL